MAQPTWCSSPNGIGMLVCAYVGACAYVRMCVCWYVRMLDMCVLYACVNMSVHSHNPWHSPLPQSVRMLVCVGHGIHPRIAAQPTWCSVLLQQCYTNFFCVDTASLQNKTEALTTTTTTTITTTTTTFGE